MPAILSVSDLDPSGIYSYADYLTWKFDVCIELIRGKLFMSPAPNVKHQQLVWRLNGMLYPIFTGAVCQAFTAPFDVRLYDAKKSRKQNSDVFTVVQPDLCVICDPSKLDDHGCNGAPDWIIEILSPGNSAREMKIKFEIYEEAGVSEYWIVQPEYECIEQFVLEETTGRYRRAGVFVADEIAAPERFPEATIDMNKLLE